MHRVWTLCLLLWNAGESNSVFQKLTCPYREEHRTLPRVWCKQTSWQCCTGFSFGYQSTHVGTLEISEDDGSFTVSMRNNNGGVHWCGVRVNQTTLIKLAERYFYSPSMYIWSITRWVVLPSALLLTCLIFYCTELSSKGIEELNLERIDALRSDETDAADENMPHKKRRR